jgi:hypothetical protein
MGTSLKTILKNYQNQLILIATPLVLLPLLFREYGGEFKKCDENDEIDCINWAQNPAEGFENPCNFTYYKIDKDPAKKPWKCMYALLLMAIYWTMEVAPLAVTSLVPMFLFPILGVLDAKKTAANYFKVTTLD